MLIYKSVENDWNKKTKLLGLTLYKRRLIDFKNAPYCEHQYLKGLFKILENKREKYFYIIGIRVLRKDKKLTFDEIEKIIETAQEKIMNQIDAVYFDMHTLNQVSYLHKEFLPYKRSLEKKDVVLVATGPSAQLYKNPIKDAIHVGVNSAIHFNWLKLDYIFVNDGFDNNPELNDEIDNYRKGICKKFYAIHSPRRLNINRKNGMSIDRIAQTHFYNADATPYVLEDAGYKRWAVNLECEPMGDIGSTSFSALQFICYTHPRRIYLVGCDAGESFSETANIKINYEHQINMWVMFQDFVSRTYPDIEIISVNPVGLKGMFKDVYTKSNLREGKC